MRCQTCTPRRGPLHQGVRPRHRAACDDAGSAGTRSSLARSHRQHRRRGHPAATEVFVLSKLGRLSIAALVVAGVALPAAPVAAAKNICVALVVDARSLDGPLSTKCTTVPDG